MSEARRQGRGVGIRLPVNPISTGGRGQIMTIIVLLPPPRFSDLPTYLICIEARHSILFRFLHPTTQKFCQKSTVTYLQKLAWISILTDAGKAQILIHHWFNIPFETVNLRIVHSRVLKDSKVKVQNFLMKKPSVNKKWPELVTCQNLHYVKPTFFSFKA